MAAFWCSRPTICASRLRALRNFAATAPDELTLIADTDLAPGQKPALHIQCCYAGPKSEGERALAPLRRERTVTHDALKQMPYLELEHMVPGEIPPSYSENRAGFFSELDDGKIDVLVDAAASAPGEVEYMFIPLYGAPTRVPFAATAFPLRRKGCMLGVTVECKPAQGLADAKRWIDRLSEKLEIDKEGNYVNVMDHEGPESVERAYGGHYGRLRALKKRYDPENLFSFNQNIQPG